MCFLFIRIPFSKSFLSNLITFAIKLLTIETALFVASNYRIINYFFKKSNVKLVFLLLLIIHKETINSLPKTIPKLKISPNNDQINKIKVC